jgi:hypothetical protein
MPGTASNTECTALSCLALATARADTSAAARWLLAAQDANGAWRYHRGGPPASWPTPIVLLALRGRAEAAAAVRAGFDWLLEQRGQSMGWWERLRQLVTGSNPVELDTTLDGWPWVPGTFAWIEPTAWALVALKATWPTHAPRAVRRRIRAGEAMILDRECPAGGWNYGNKRVLDQDAAPYPDTTALALLALLGRRDAAIERGIGSLLRQLDDRASTLALSLGTVCLRAWGRDVTAPEGRLVSHLQAAAPEETRTLALAVLAGRPTPDWLRGRAGG